MTFMSISSGSPPGSAAGKTGGGQRGRWKKNVWTPALEPGLKPAFGWRSAAGRPGRTPWRAFSRGLVKQPLNRLARGQKRD
jgi:hypothetical protein